MRNFAQIQAAIPANNSIGDNPPLRLAYNPVTQSIVAALNPGVHITIFQNSWDGQIGIRDMDGQNVTVGPYCLHLTAVGSERWFYQYDVPSDTWFYVTDYGTPNPTQQKAFTLMMNTLRPLLSN